MKTLDEVIEAYEQCASEDLMSGCGKCVYKKARLDWGKDADK